MAWVSLSDWDESSFRDTGVNRQGRLGKGEGKKQGRREWAMDIKKERGPEGGCSSQGICGSSRITVLAVSLGAPPVDEDEEDCFFWDLQSAGLCTTHMPLPPLGLLWPRHQ